MKKSILIVLVLLLLLTACQVMPDNDQSLASTPSSSSSITPPPSSNVVPTTQPTAAPTTPTTVHPTVPITKPTVPPTTPVTPTLGDTGYAFVYKGENPFWGINPNLSACVAGHLYWVDKTTQAVTCISNESVSDHITEGVFVYYVKTAEPTKIYRTNIGDFSRCEVIYESVHGKISNMLIDTVTIQEQLVLQFVADNRKFVVVDLNTGEDAVLTEQYYIQSAMFDHGSADTWKGLADFVFWGKLDENDSVKSYRYFIQTGEIREEEECAD